MTGDFSKYALFEGRISNCILIYIKFNDERVKAVNPVMQLLCLLIYISVAAAFTAFIVEAVFHRMGKVYITYIYFIV